MQQQSSGPAAARVLVVDDDPTVAEVVAGYLDRAGYAVDRAGDGPAAPARAAEHRPDLVVLDLMLPGMDGLEVCRLLRTRGPVPVVMLTARGDEDDRVLSRVLGNLLVNAIRRTPADGTVAITAERSPDGVVLSVTDRCGGIPEEDLPRVFDTGWVGTHARTPPAGAGLGLAIVRGIVEAHRGQATVHNIPGGCRFEVVLPAAAS